MKNFLVAIAATLLLGTGAHAATISVQTFDYTSFGNLTKNAVIEDFETPENLDFTFEAGTPKGTSPNQFGEIKKGTSIGTSVGSFTGLGGKGGGDTCKRLDIDGKGCHNIALQYDPSMNGQGNIVPQDGDWSINAADTLGVEWTAFLPGGKKFKSVVFAIRDAADQGATLMVEAAGQTAIFKNLGNNNEKLVFIDFGGAVDSAIITMKNNKVNDSFTIDGAAINAVPLPAAALFLLGGLGMMAGLRKRKAA